MSFYVTKNVWLAICTIQLKQEQPPSYVGTVRTVLSVHSFPAYTPPGSISIAPTRDCKHFLKIKCLVAGGGFYSYYIHQGNKLK